MEHENTTARVISPDKPDKSPGPKHAGKYNYYDMRDALERAAGRISLVAAHFKCSPQTVRNYMKRYPELEEFRRGLVSNIGDMAISQFWLALQRGEKWAIQRGLRKFAKFADPRLSD